MAWVIYGAGLAILVGCCAFSWWKGGAAERYGSILILVANVLADVAEMVAHRHGYPYFAEFVIDLGLALGLLFLAVQFSSMWLGFAMLLQSLVIGSYAMQAFGDGLNNKQYIDLSNVVTLTMLLSIAAGTLASWRRRIRASRSPHPPQVRRASTSVTA